MDEKKRLLEHQNNQQDYLLIVESSRRMHRCFWRCVVVVLLFIFMASLIGLSVEVFLNYGQDKDVDEASDSPVPELSDTAKTFKAAAYEQKVVKVYNATTRKEALKAILGNLANMERQAKIAKSKVCI